MEPSRISAAFFVVIIVGFLYALSVGPVAVITKRGWVRTSTFKQAYAPIIWLDDHTLLKKPIDAYVKLWGFP
jgi:hypothetical protein